MEPVEVIIARLVLGYLKRANSKSAYNEFLRNSDCLQDHYPNKSKYIPTRFSGLTLEEILNEYFKISLIVQGRLEPTNYYNEGHSRPSLLKQLLYLLNKVPTSRASTPCPHSPLESNLGETSPSYIEHISDVEATPAHTLPGNTQYESEECYMPKTSRRKTLTKYVKSGPLTSSPLMEKEDVSEVLAQTLLENREFHEKIAQTINKVTEKQLKSSAKLDKTVKTVMRETEEDPIFDKILDEIISSTNLVDNNKAIETSSTASSNACTSGYRKRHDTVGDSEEPCRNSENKNIDQQNDAAIQSIVASSQMTTNCQPIGSQGTGEVVVFDGSLDKYLVSDNVVPTVIQTQPIQNQLYINTTATLFIPTSVSGYSAYITNQNKKQVAANQQPTVCNWTTPGIITENDILSMPTVIINDSGSTKSNTVPVSQGINTSSNLPHKALLPKPKPKIEVSADLSEYLNLNNCDSDPKPKEGLKNVHYPNSSKASTSTDTSSAKPTSTAAGADMPLTSNTEEQITANSKTTGEQIPTRKEIISTTPAPVEPVKKATPKSGSHVRNLDFSSPPKLTAAQKKGIQSKQGNKSPHFVHKKQAAKLLFGEEKEKEKNKIWDADLRAICLQPSDDEVKVSCTKKIPGVKKFRKKAKDTKRMNTTEQEGALMEAALATPAKKQDNEEKVEELKTEEPPELMKKTEKTVLSPSKFNANKRNLVNTKNEETEPKSKFVTPETSKETIACPMKANRNIMSLLETPLKDNVLPKTPGLLTPLDMNVSTLSNITPFTKMLEDNLKGIDISSIPTPNLPITPNFPSFTPTVDAITPFSNRPTDYSTSSSYYQPSDNEQNKSLEAQLREVEKKSPTVDHLSIFNKHVIGKKNLSLMRRSASKSSMSSSSTELEDDDSLSNWVEKGSNDTVILRKKSAETPKRIYSLRNRSVSKEMTKKINHRIVSSDASIDVEEKKEAEEIVEVKTKKIIKKTEKVVHVAEKGVEVTEKKDERASSKKSAQAHKKRKVSDTPKPIESECGEGTDEMKKGKKTSRLSNKTKNEEKILPPQTKQVTNKDSGRKAAKKSVSKVKKLPVEIEENLVEKPSKTSQKTNDITKPGNSDTQPKKVGAALIKPTADEEKAAKKLKILKELEEKRQRMIKKLKNKTETAPAKPVETSKKLINNGKFKIKLVSNASSSRKRPRKSVSPRKKILPNTSESSEDEIVVDYKKNLDKRCLNVPETSKSDKSASDVEAQNLIEGLKQRGIHLMQNKSPKKKIEEDVKEEEKDSEANVSQNCSSSQIDTFFRDTYDRKTFEGEDKHIIFDGRDVSKILNYSESENPLNKTFIGKVYLEELGEEIDVPLKFSPFYTLIDIPSETKVSDVEIEHEKEVLDSEKKIIIQDVVFLNDLKNEEECVGEKDNIKRIDVTVNESSDKDAEMQDTKCETIKDYPFEENTIEDDLMNFASTGKDYQERTQSPSTKKRKLADGNNSHTEKKAKKLLKKIDVDSFLNNIHAGTNFYLKK